MIHTFTSAPSASASYDHLRTLLGVPDLRVARQYFVEFATDPTTEQLQALAAALVGDLDQPYAVDAPHPSGAVGIAFKLGVVDTENSSIVDFCAAYGLDARAAKVADLYLSDSPGLANSLRAHLFNASNQLMYDAAPAWEHLRPEGHAAEVEWHRLQDLDDQALAALGQAGGRSLTGEQMRVIRDIEAATGAAATSDALIEALDARWSDHCAHTTWKSLGNLLKRLKTASAETENPNIVSMFDDNAGVWDFYDGQALTIKAETHNGPTAIAPYFGQLTKVGGVLRDILGTGLGSDPVGSFEYTATGPLGQPPVIPGRPSAEQIALETIRAVREYGNTFGVPMMASRMSFRSGYAAKPFALGGSLGVIPTALAGRQKPQVGDAVVLIGGLTGDEGMHGASASSAGAEMIESAVQIGTPLEEVKFRGAILDLRDAGCLSAITDLGAAGLNSAVGEMGEATGVWMNTALVPLKTSALAPWKILLSESQERMLLAVPVERLGLARDLCARHEVRMTVIGRFVDTQRYAVVHDPAMDEQSAVATAGVPAAGVLFDVPYELIDPPVAQVTTDAPPAPSEPISWPELDPVALLPAILAHPEVADQQFASSQYDTTVRGATVHGPQHGPLDTRVDTTYWAGRVAEGSDGLAILTTAFDPLAFEVHPVRATRQMWLRALMGQVLAGADLRDVCLTDNFYTPHTSPDSAAWLVAMVDEVAALVRHFGTPVISGKDSSAGSVDTPSGTVHVPPAVYLSALGKVPRADVLLPEMWQQDGNVLVRIGIPTPAYEGTVAMDVTSPWSRPSGEPGALDDVPLDDATRVLGALAEARAQLVSGSLVGTGGVLATVAKGSLASGLGIELAEGLSAADLVGEHRACALVELAPESLPGLPLELQAVVIGTLRSAPGVRLGDQELLTSAARDAWSTSFERSIHEAGR